MEARDFARFFRDTAKTVESTRNRTGLASKTRAMRKARVVLPGCPHHVVHRGNNRRRLFSYPRDYYLFLRLLWSAAEKTGSRIHALCLMANHIHLIVTPAATRALAAFVKSFAQRYAQLRNGERSASGKLFEERFWSEPLKTTFLLAAVTMYIDRNPVTAGLKPEPELYRWSSYRIHAGLGDPEKAIAALCTPTDWYRSLGSSIEERAAEYEQLFQLYSATALARAQDEFFRKIERRTGLYTRRLERPDRTGACEPTGFSRYG
jgi:putative transposase